MFGRSLAQGLLNKYLEGKLMSVSDSVRLLSLLKVLSGSWYLWADSSSSYAVGLWLASHSSCFSSPLESDAMELRGLLE